MPERAEAVAVQDLRAGASGGQLLDRRGQYRDQLHEHVHPEGGRDFQPATPPDGKPLIALIRVIAIDLLPFPSTLDANRLWVINGQEVWEKEFSDEEIPTDPNRKHQLEKIARNGPKWGPGIYVDVVVRIIDYKNKTYLLKASNQYIGRTD